MLKNLFNRFLSTPPAPPPLPVATAVPAVAADDIAAADALISSGNALEDAGSLEQAEALYRQAVARAPAHARAHLNLGIVLAALERHDDAAAAYEKVLAIDPRHPFGNYNYARLAYVRRDLVRAGTLVAKALEAKPDFLQALELSHGIVRDEGFADAALALAQTIIQRDPTGGLHRAFELMAMNFVDGVRPDVLFRKHAEFGSALEQAVPVRFDRYRDPGDPKRRLRVGYFSCDFMVHPVSFFLAPVLEHHDRSQVEVFCYSLTARHDAMTARVRAAADHWRDVISLSDEELADAIHADGIDVLVDLIGYTGIPRPAVFCQRPAPVQVAWLGYLNTTGLTRMDYRISDVRSDPPEISQSFHTERLVFMPESQWCYPGEVEQEIDPVPPFERNGVVTFGSFNSALKITPEACRRWARVMLRMPGSLMVIGNILSERKRAAILREFVGLGVAEERLTFLPRIEGGDHLRLYDGVDLTFDTFPYGGGTTTFDSLWMGVPVVAAVGETPVARSAASLLATLDLDDWIASSVDDFVDVAVARASDRQALATLRRELRARLQASPLTDVKRFAHDLEAAYRGIWLARVG